MGVESVLDANVLSAAIEAVSLVRLSDDIIAYVVKLIRATREHPVFETGASPRAAAMLATAARSRAALDGRDYVIPDDVKQLAKPALRHRVILSPTAEIEGRTSDEAVDMIIATGRSTTMIYPTGRAVMIMGLGVPIALLVAVLIPGAWTLGLGWILITFVLMVVDLGHEHLPQRHLHCARLARGSVYRFK